MQNLMAYTIQCRKMVQISHTHIGYKICVEKYTKICRLHINKYHQTLATRKFLYQRRSQHRFNHCSWIMICCFSSTKGFFSNDKESIELDYPKTKNNERSSMQEPITKYNDGYDTQKTITEDIADSVLLELQSQWVRPESQDYLKTDHVLLEFMEDPWKEIKKKIRQWVPDQFFLVQKNNMM